MADESLSHSRENGQEDSLDYSGELPEELEVPKEGELPSHGLYKIYRSYVEHEDDLVNQRLYRLFIAHASLAAATGVIISKVSDTELRRYVPIALLLFGLLSILLCISQFIAIHAGCMAIANLDKLWRQRSRHMRGANVLPPLVGGGMKKNDRYGRLTALAAPIILGAFWIIAICGGIALWPHRGR